MNTKKSVSKNSFAYFTARHMTPRLIATDALTMITDFRIYETITKLVHDNQIIFLVKGNYRTTYRTKNYGLHEFSADLEPRHIITIYRSTRKRMLRAMVHEMIHAWQSETKYDWVKRMDKKHDPNGSDQDYWDNAPEKEARKYEAKFTRNYFRRKHGFAGPKVDCLNSCRFLFSKAEDFRYNHCYNKSADYMKRIIRLLKRYHYTKKTCVPVVYFLAKNNLSYAKFRLAKDEKAIAKYRTKYRNKKRRPQ
jgi:hypothetical protein